MPDLETARSPLDLLHPGAGPELRDARLLAWLLDPAGEHGLSRALLVACATCLAGRGRSELSTLLASPAPPSVEVELRLRGGRVEVVVACGRRELVLPWRAQARAEDAELPGLVGPQVDVLGVGQADGVFPPGLPVFTWRELLRALEGAPQGAPEPWVGLLGAFRARLRALLGEQAPAAAPVSTPPPQARPLPAEPPPLRVPELAQAGAAPPPAPSSATRRMARPDGRGLAERLLQELPGLARWVPGCTPPALRPRSVEEGTMLQGPDRQRIYLIHRRLGSDAEAAQFEVMIQGQASFPGYEEEVGVATIKVPHEGSTVLERERAALATPHPALGRLLCAEAGNPPFLVLERLAPHPVGAFGKVDPVTAINTFVNLLAALSGVHERLGRILCGITPGNLRLRIAAEGPGAEYLARLASGAWEPVLVDQTETVLGGAPPPVLTGDPLWLPPESLPRASGPARFSRKTDVYALTLTFYTLLTGDRPYGRLDLHEKTGAAWLGELLAQKEKGTSPINGMILHERFAAPVVEALLELFRAGLAPDPTQRRSAEDLLQLCKEKLGVVERRPAIAPEAYVWDDAPGLQLAQQRLPAGDLSRFYAS